MPVALSPEPPIVPQPPDPLGPLARRWARPHAAAAPWSPPAVPTVVVVPHPDDEVLAAGGLIARQAAAGAPVTVVAVTDGEAAYADVPSGLDLAGLRRREQATALDRLGVPAVCVERLGLPDGRVADHEVELAGRLAFLCDGAALVVAPATVDHHCDHEATGRAVALALAHRPEVQRVESLFWTWHHLTPDALAARRLLRLDLTEDERGRRRHALEAHASQIADAVAEPPLLGPGELEPVEWAAEYFLVPTP